LAVLLRRSERSRPRLPDALRLKEHFERGTLVDGLPSARLPALFLHGKDDPLPARCSTETAALMLDATVELMPDCGHFPWLERPGAVADAVERLLARA
jgi:pimeloyl-ACP methyl ester carboxylesterase